MKHIASCSFGKDSIATIILAHEHNEPLDEIVFAHVMYDKNKGWSGENPEHIDFINNVAIPRFESWGYKVTVLVADIDYKTWFLKEFVRGNNKGIPHGYPIPRMCSISGYMKQKPMKQYLKNVDCIQYVGIAVDEPKRLESLKKYDNRVSLLEKYGITEEQAYKMCEEYGLLSPIYNTSSRGGCWFCPNCKIEELKTFRKNNKEMYYDLLELDKIEPKGRNLWNYSKTLRQLEEEFVAEENQKTLLDYLDED